jgi:hypothetical protein
MTDTYYTLHTNKYKYFLYITDNNGAYSVKIGGLKHDCVNFNIYNPKYKLTLLNPIEFNSEYAQLPYLERKDLCAYNIFLEPTEGTHDMLKASFSFIKDTFKWVKYIEFLDSSKKDLPGTNEYTELYILYISIKGKTWYENYYGAQLKNKELRENYNTKINILKTQNLHSYFMELWKQTYIGTKYENDVYILLDNIIFDIYNKSATLLEFFNNIRKKVSKEEYFYMTKTWIRDILFKLLGTEFISNKWVIPINHIDKTEFKLIHINKTNKNNIIKKRVNEIKDLIQKNNTKRTKEINDIILKYGNSRM